MTDTKPDRPSVFARLREPAALNYLVMTGAGLLVYGMIMMGRGNDAGALLAVLLAIPGILARWTASPILILLLTTYLLIDPGFMTLTGFVTGLPWATPRAPGGFNLEDVILAAALLAYVIGHFRLTSILHQGMPDEPTARRDARPAEPAEAAGRDRRPGRVAADPRRRLRVRDRRPGRVGGDRVRRAGRPARRFCIPRDRPVPDRRLGNRPRAAGGLGGARVPADARHDAAEAALVLRDEFFQENRRETDRLQRWRKWYKERVALRRRAGK